MEHTHEVHGEHHGGGTKEVIKITIFLTVLTLVELAIGFYMYKAALPDTFFKHFLKGVICILMLWKAFYIVAYFMHLKHELRNMIMTIVVPLLLFVWFITAFLYDGNSFRNLRNTYDRHFKESSSVKAPVQEHETEHKEGEKKVVE